MTFPRAIFFGAIGTLTETSDLQRRAFNAAFEEAGLGWHWSTEDYRAMLAAPGGKRRIARHAEGRGDRVDAEALHASKIRHFEALVEAEGITPRPGVRELIDWAHSNEIRVGFATTTSLETVTLILNGLMPGITRSDFGFIGDQSQVTASKPAPDIYEIGLKALDVLPSEAAAVEDTPESAKAACAAGLATFGFPGRAARGRSFPRGVHVIEAPHCEMFDRAVVTTG